MADPRNPFSMTPKVGRASSRPDLEQRPYNQPVAQPGLDGLQIVNSLIQFAGVAGDAYVQKTAKKVEADKAVQTALAMQNMQPTDDATVAGYQAHAAVAIKSQSLGAQARLHALAQQDMTDEQWNEAIREEYRNQDEYLTSNYDQYSKNIEMQKLAAVSFREIMPQVGATRAASKIGFEIQKRVQSATDTFINAAANPLIADAPVEDMLTVTNGLLDSLQLTASQKDKALEDAIIGTRNPALIKLSEKYTGDRSSSLFSRSGKIQQIKAQLESEEMATQGIAFEKEINSVINMMVGSEGNPPSMTREDGDKYFERRNKETGGNFMSRSRYASIQGAIDAGMQKAYIGKSVSEALINPDITNLKGLFKPAEIQSGIGTMIANSEAVGEAEGKKQGLQGAELERYKDKFRLQSQQYIADLTVKSNDLYDTWVTDLSALANMPVDARMLQATTKEGNVVKTLPQQADKATKLLQNMSETAKREYLTKVGGDEEKILKRYLHELELGVSGPEALATSQRRVANPSPPQFKLIKKATEDIFSSSEFGFWRADSPDNQEAYLLNQIREKVMLDPVADSPTGKTRILNWLEKGWTTTESGMKLEGSPEQLHEHTNMHIDHLDRAMDSFIKSNATAIMPHLEGLGLSLEDVFPVTNPLNGRMSLHTTHGEIIGTSTPMKNLVSIDRKYNNEASKRLWEQRAVFKRLKEGGQIYD